jgi:hypothetical protein
MVAPGNHISDHDLERHYLGMVTVEADLALIEEHLLWCSQCATRAEKSDAYVDAMRVGMLQFDEF